MSSDHHGNLRLIELDKDMVEELEKGNCLTFKGALNDKVVLCTKNKTYEIKEAQQSNSLLVIPDLLPAEKTNHGSPLKSPPSNNINKSLDKSLEDDEIESLPVEHEIREAKIENIFFNYLEPRQVKPQSKKIHDLLHLTLYNGPENEHQIERKFLFTRRQIFETAQCSAGEFEELIRKIRAIKVDGFMRVLDYGYEFRVVTMLTSLITENSWELNEVDRDESIAALNGIIPKEIAEAVFDFYTESVSETGKFMFKEDMVCRIIAKNVLQEGLKFHIEEFLETCQEALPPGMIMNENFLGGIGLVDRESQMPSIRGMFEENLPTDLMERLKVLFKAKEKWTLQQISPYVDVFTTPKLEVTALLAKFCRSITENNVRFFVAKHK
jgi:sister chromatid cohesion protein DCC1